MKKFLSVLSLAAFISPLAFAADAPPLAGSTVSPTPLFVTSTKPAVDGVNGKLQVYGGVGQNNSVSISSFLGLAPQAESKTVWNGIGGATGTITVPLGHSFGAQLDLGAGSFGNSQLGAAGGHLFWRDPEKGLIGAYGDGLLLGSKVGSSVWTAAGEFETYLGKFTGRAILGIQGASYQTAGLNPLEIYAYGGRKAFTTPDYFTDIVSATFYPIDDLAISVGHIYSFGRNAVTGEVEYLLPQLRGGNIAPSAFVSASYGWNNSSNIMAGIRVYFGNHDKSLIRRQREDDPQHQNATKNVVRVEKYKPEGRGGSGGILWGNGGTGGYTPNIVYMEPISLTSQ
jgi:hypothetical protein